MFRFLKNLFRQKSQNSSQTVCIEDYDDEVRAMCILECIKTGNIILGTRNKDGTVELTEVPRDK